MVGFSLGVGERLSQDWRTALLLLGKVGVVILLQCGDVALLGSGLVGDHGEERVPLWWVNLALALLVHPLQHLTPLLIVDVLTVERPHHDA